jgi:hypothetical protein
MSTNTSTDSKGVNMKLIVGIVVALGIIGGSVYGFQTGMFKPDPKAMADIPDGD